MDVDIQWTSFNTRATYASIFSLSAETLNALYVYEAKMSFLTRLAATKEGAERLLEARILPKLAQCTFLEARPRPNGAYSVPLYLSNYADCHFSLADIMGEPMAFVSMFSRSRYYD